MPCSLSQFLNHVLPSEGFYCSWTYTNGRPSQSFFKTVGDLAANLSGIDALKNNAYFACSSFKESGKRKQSNVAFAKAFWLDIDVKDKPDAYHEFNEALEAAENFIDAADLPTPTLVYSGNGIHLWWVLDRAITKEEWEPVAKSLKKLCAVHGLLADPSRTSDMASILRPPGTFNWKDPQNPKEVHCDTLEDPIESGLFMQKVHGTRVPLVPVPFADASKFTNVGTPHYEPSSALLASNHCGQLRNFRETGGNIPEPLWYACLGVLAHCTDGGELSQEWSKGHPNYNSEDTAKKLAQAKAASGPTTCERFKSLCPGTCALCPHNKTSPIQLGYEAVITPPVIPAEDEKLHADYPFFYDGFNRLCMETEIEDENGEKKKGDSLVISHTPLLLKAVRKEERGSGRTYEFAHKLPHQNSWERFSIPAKDLSGTGMRAMMNANGCNLSVGNAKYFASFLTQAVNRVRNEMPETIAYNSYGWKNSDTDFLVGTKLYKGDGKIVRVAGTGDVEPRSDFFEPKSTASLSEWRRFANYLFAPNCEAQAFGLLASFGAILMKFATGVDEGGAVLSFVSAASGVGKTTTLSSIASVWGDIRAMRMINSDTMNAKIRSFATMGNLPIVYDEFNRMDPKILQQLIQTYTTGRDKQRLTKTGEVVHGYGEWQNILISASNTSLIDVLQADGGDPQSARIFEVALEPPPSGTLSSGKELQWGLEANAGLAGPAFLTLLMQPAFRGFAEKKVKEMVLAYEQKIGFGTSFRYIHRLMACVHVAGALVQHSGLLEFDLARIMNWAVHIAIERGRSGPTGFSAVDIIQAFLEDNFRGCLRVTGAFNAKVPTIIISPEPSAGIVSRFERDPKKLYIRSDVMRKIAVKHRCNYVHICRELEEKGIILNRNRMTLLTAGTNYPSARAACWEIDTSHPLMSSDAMKLIVDEKEKVA